MDATVIVGIDVSKDRLDIHVRPEGLAFAVGRDGDGIATLAERLGRMAPEAVGIEATGGFETVVAAGLAAAGLPVVVVNPAQVRAFANALGRRAKTDPIDAAVIAHFVAATRPAIRPLPDEKTRLLADLVARRRQIVAMIGAEHQREKRAPARIVRSIRRLVKALDKELAALDGDIGGVVRSSPAWREGGSARLRAGRRPDHRPHAPCRAARAGHSRPAPGRGSGRRRALDAAIGHLARQELHRRRQGRRPLRPFHGRHGRGSPQP